MSGPPKPPSFFALVKQAVGQMGDTSAQKKLPYKKKPHLLTEAERAFHIALCEAVKEAFLVFAKVRLVDLVYLPAGVSRARAHQQRILTEQVDFALFDPKSVEPRLMIELEDPTVAKSQREKQVEFLEAVARDVKLPFLNMRVQKSYEKAELREMLKEAMKLP